jgi:type II secretory pathway pseudopilin PulG
LFCNQCGANIADGSKFCPICGTKFAEATPSIPAKTPPPPPAGVAAQQPSAQVRPMMPGPAGPVPWLNVPAGPQQTDGKAVGSLICGIVSITFIPILAAIPAVILGHMSRSEIKRSMGRLKGEGMALAGLIMGYMSVAVIPFILIIAAIAIPNLMRSRMAANESAAAQTVRTLITNQIAYSTMYAERGYAKDLASLGGASPCTPSAEHACLMDPALAGPQCTAGAWCTRDAFKFTIVTPDSMPVTEFVIAATPTVENAGRKSFCAFSDGIVRFKPGLITEPPSVDECRTWVAL